VKVVISGKTYDLTDIQRMTLRDAITLEIESAALGRRITLNDVKAMQEAVAECKTEEEANEHPDAQMLFGVAVWVSRRKAGEDISFIDGISFDLDQMEVVVSDEERAELAARRAKPDPTRTRPGSGAGVKRPTDRAKKAASKPKSSAA
jgi:hypothetical protein